jgi:hypothetical protein
MLDVEEQGELGVPHVDKEFSDTYYSPLMYAGDY